MWPSNLLGKQNKKNKKNEIFEQSHILILSNLIDLKTKIGANFLRMTFEVSAKNFVLQMRKGMNIGSETFQST